MPFALDSSCIVALLSAWHPNSQAVSAEVNSLLETDPPLVIPAPALLEAYSVLTRMPPPYRAAPRTTLEALRDLLSSAVITSLKPDEYWPELEQCAASGICGGAVHDAIIAACARQSGAGKLLTLNLNHFARFAGSELSILTPR